VLNKKYFHQILQEFSTRANISQNYPNHNKNLFNLISFLLLAISCVWNFYKRKNIGRAITSSSQIKILCRIEKFMKINPSLLSCTSTHTIIFFSTSHTHPQSLSSTWGAYKNLSQVDRKLFLHLLPLATFFICWERRIFTSILRGGLISDE
jgi:hypothetical protein